MEEMCVKPQKKIKKRQKCLVHLDKILEEEAVSQSDVNDAALKVVSDITDELLQSLIQNEDVTETLPASKDEHVAVKHDDDLQESNLPVIGMASNAEIFQQVDELPKWTTNNTELVAITYNEIERETDPHPSLEIPEYKPILNRKPKHDIVTRTVIDKLKSEQTKSLPQNFEKALQTNKPYEIERPIPGILKPSVFVGEKGRPYSSSLEIGHHWDRTKYNPVLLPDLSKVVYPDLDSFSDSSNTPIPKNPRPTLPSLNRLNKPQMLIDRNKKPSADSTQSPKANESEHVKLLENETVMIIESDKAVPHDNYAITSNVSKYPDYLVGFHNLKIWKDPLEWDLKTNQQLVLFEVNSILYEEIFANCINTSGLISAIEERAKFLGDRQQWLQTQILESTNVETFILANSGVLTMYQFSGFITIKNKQALVTNSTYQVNHMFFEQAEFVSRSYPKDAKHAKLRAESILRLQAKLRGKVNILLGKEVPLEDESCELDTPVQMIDLGSPNLKSTYEQLPLSLKPRKSKPVTRFQAIRNLLKNTFVGKNKSTRRNISSSPVETTNLLTPADSEFTTPINSAHAFGSGNNANENPEIPSSSQQSRSPNKKRTIFGMFGSRQH